MTTHEYTPDELISLAADDLKAAGRLSADQVADPTTVSRILVAYASSQACSMLAMARLLHQQVHDHPVDTKSNYERVLEDLQKTGPVIFDPVVGSYPGHLDGLPEAPLSGGEISALRALLAVDWRLTADETRRLRAFLSDETAS